MRLLRAADRAPAPWKNGGGVTYEVAVEPPGAGFADFGWRLSTAVIAADGPFSRFDGIDRTLVLVEGDGLRLDIAGRAVELTPEAAIVEFAGEEPVHAALASGPILDLNLMVRRGAWRSSLSRRRVGGGERLAAAEVLLVFALENVALSTPEGVVVLAPKDALLLGAGEQVEFAGPAAAAGLILAELHQA